MKPLRAYCTCGAKLEASSDPPIMAREAVRLFHTLHTGPGHEPTTALVARRARARRMAQLRRDVGYQP